MGLIFSCGWNNVIPTAARRKNLHMKLGALILLVALTLAVGWAQVAAERPRSSRGHVRDFDIRSRGSAEDSTHEKETARAAARGQAVREKVASRSGGRDGWRVNLGKSGTPASIYAEGRSLTEASTQDPEPLARDFLTQQRDLFGLSESGVAELRLLRRAAADGVTYLRFQQTLKGVDVFEGQLRVTVDSRGRVMEAGAGDLLGAADLNLTPSLTPEAAVRAAYQLLEIPVSGPLKLIESASSRAMKYENPRGLELSPVSTELMVFPLESERAALGYRLMLEMDGAGWYEIVMDAHDGRLLFLHNLYRDASARVWKESPLKGSRSVVELPANWLSGLVTTGNNVDAYLDRDGNNQPDTLTATGIRNGRAYSPDANFDFTVGDRTISVSPLLHPAGAVTNLFYFVNLAHDYYYGLGFDEAAGNFQTDNTDKGGKPGDPVRAESQDGLVTNNANFATPPDGTSPRMQMGIFTYGSSGAANYNDSSNDGMVVFHEYGHGVSNRLVGGGTATSCLSGVQSGAMGEGWSDYFAATYFNNPLMSTYISRSNFTGSRRSGYERYPYTYEDLGNEGHEVHRDGEIWAATLWDVRRRLGAAATDKLVIAALRVTPCRPSMIQARDAMLAADELLNGGSNRALLWQVFAARGMGKSANGTDGTFPSGTIFTAAYDVPLAEDSTLNRQPVVTPRAVPLISMGQTFSYKLDASDPDGDTLTFNLLTGPSGLTIDSATGQVQWTSTFAGGPVRVEVLDGRGGRVVHGFTVFVLTVLRLGTGMPVSLYEGDAGFAAVNVPAGASVLQVTLRGGYGDGDLWLANPDGVYVGRSLRDGNIETLSIAAPRAGVWTVVLDAYRGFGGVTLTAATPTPRVLTLPGTVEGQGGDFTSEAFYQVTVAENTPLLEVKTDLGSGDVDLLVRRGTVPACSADDEVIAPCVYDGISQGLTTSETVLITKPAADNYYVNLRAFTQYSGVRLTVRALGVRAVPSTLAFTFTTGGPAVEAQKVVISEFSGAAINWTAVTEATWLGLDRRFGSQETPLTVSVVPSGLAPGTYETNITVTVPNTAGSPLNIPVKLTVK